MFKIKANPTFRVKVKIPEPGGTTMPLDLEFKHRTKTELETWANKEETKDKTNVDWLMDIIVGWHDVDAPFSRDNLDAVLENYLGAALAIRTAYLDELTGARLGN